MASKQQTRSLQLFLVLASLALVVVAILGLTDASYISYNELTGQVPPCSPNFKCETVLQSKWSKIGPVPLSLLGVGYYIVVLSFALWHYLDQPFIKIGQVKLRTDLVLMLLTTSGLLFSGYLVFIMGVVLKAWCFYCLISAATSTTLFFVSMAVVRLRSALYKKQGPSTFFLRHGLFQLSYLYVAKPLFFLFNAELVHNTLVSTGQFLGKIPPLRALTRSLFAYAHPSLKRKIDGITFGNPVGLSAGFDYNGQLTQIMPSVGFGFMTIGTVTYQASEGNAGPQLGRFPKSKALLVNKGFRNNGAAAVIKQLTPHKFTIPVGISIGSTNTEFASLEAQIKDIIECFKLFELSQLKHAFYELNISCPNTVGGQPFTTPDRLQKLLTKVSSLRIKKPIYLKMPIDLSDAEALALLKVADKHRIAGVIFGNLTKDKKNPALHPEDLAVWKKVAGNVSGKPTFERSLRLIKLTRKHFANRFTIIGTGGIFSPEDAQTKLEAGADLVQLITGMIFQGPQLIGQINARLSLTQKV